MVSAIWLTATETRKLVQNGGGVWYTRMKQEKDTEEEKTRLVKTENELFLQMHAVVQWYVEVITV